MLFEPSIAHAFCERVINHNYQSIQLNTLHSIPCACIPKQWFDVHTMNNVCCNCTVVLVPSCTRASLIATINYNNTHHSHEKRVAAVAQTPHSPLPYPRILYDAIHQCFIFLPFPSAEATVFGFASVISFAFHSLVILFLYFRLFSCASFPFSPILDTTEPAQ
eukprot:m.96181 g.96181  ORF g.96181 m.96181 type:complete len:163 (+) comp13066_c0_seq1:2113-2601(+)